MTTTLSVAEKVGEIRERVEKAAARAGRRPESITLMGVSKTVSPPYIEEAYEAGLRIFGENRVQEFSQKMCHLAQLRDAEWRLIGHLQTNKARKAAEIFHGVDSVDSLRLAEKLHEAAQQAGKVLSVLIEIKTSREESKSGIMPGSAELEKILLSAANLDHIKVRGLMTVPPYSGDPEASRPYFRRLRCLAQEIMARKLPGVEMESLSMGMSHDFEAAIAEGATCVRVGTAIFGERPKPNAM